jgi:hypothetical protein
VNRMAALGEAEGVEEPTALFDLRKSLGAFAARKRAAEAEFEAKIDLKVRSPNHRMASPVASPSQSGLSMHCCRAGQNR